MADVGRDRPILSNILRSFPALLLVCIVVLSAPMLPVYWSGNEINYFDLAFRYVRPDLFGNAHAVFDSSNARFLSFTIIGSAIDIVGFETAKVLFALLCILLYALALSLLAAALRLDAVAVAVALSFYLGHQSLLGGEWIFGAIEAKVFAYVCALLAISAALSGRWTLAVVLGAAGAAFHFLVGGFWGLAVVALRAVSTRDWRGTARSLAVFALLISPIIAILASERIGAQVDLTSLDLSLSQIYAEFRAPHHVAPFAGGMGSFAAAWFSGFVLHAGLAVAFWLMRNDFGARSAIALWVAGLNAYIFLVMVISFLDRETHLFAPLYMFRPSGLILLLSILLIVRCVTDAIPVDLYRRLKVPALVVVAAFILPDVALKVARMATEGPLDRRVEATMSQTQSDILDWLREGTVDGSVVLVQPRRGYGDLSEGAAFPAALERLTPAAYYVNFKWVPTAPADLAEWYRRLLERRAVFDGDCALLRERSIDYLVAYASFDGSLLESCTTVVHRNADYVIFQARRS